MEFKVIIDGKPCSGKTTLSNTVEKELPKEGISAIDAKAYALEKGFFSGFLRKFSEGEIDSYRSLFYSATYHLLSYVALEQSAWKNEGKYDVVILQRSPYAFSFMIEAAKSVSGKESAYKQSSLLYGVIKAWAGVVRPDLFIYLTADVETLRERFKHRPDGRDRIHAKMIEEDDSRYIEQLKQYMRKGLCIISNTSTIKEGTEAVSSAISKAYKESKLQNRHPYAAYAEEQ
jgi:deoxyadenosine/deoxycytidine kinase